MRRNKREITIWVIACLFIGIFGAVIAIELFGQPVYNIGPVKVKLSVSPDSTGTTVVSVPPLGRMTAQTHNAPVKLTASIEEMNVNDVRKVLVNRPKASKVLAETRVEADRAFRSFALRIMMLALVGGAASAFLISPRRRLAAALIGAVGGLGIIGGVTGAAAFSFEPSALSEPRYQGALRSAPWMVKLVRQGFFHLDTLDTELRTAAANLSDVEGQISALAPVENGGPVKKLLVVSDLHNNTTVMRIVSDLAQAFDVEMVLDAGDLTDLGTQFEESMSAVMGDIPRPHIFVGGNHDSPQTFAALRKLKNTHLPDEGVVNIAGVSILGQSDPGSASRNNLVSSRSQLERSKRQLLQRYGKLKNPPDVVIVHSPRVAKAFVGKAPIVINGDDHKMWVRQVGNTVWVDPGTTGASGLRYFKSGSPKDITAVVVYISESPKVHAIAADLITIQSPRGEFSIQRKRFNGKVSVEQNRK